MTPSLVIATLAVAALLSGWAGVYAIRDQLPGKRFLQGLFVLEGVLFAQLGYLLYLLGGGGRPAETGAFAAYLILSLLLVPGGLALSVDERTRYGTLTVLISLLAVLVIEWRLIGTWR